VPGLAKNLLPKAFPQDVGALPDGQHVHFITVPMEEDSLARVFNTLPMRYSQYINDRRNARGRLWQGGQGRFFSCVLDERHL